MAVTWMGFSASCSHADAHVLRCSSFFVAGSLFGARCPPFPPPAAYIMYKAVVGRRGGAGGRSGGWRCGGWLRCVGMWVQHPVVTLPASVPARPPALRRSRRSGSRWAAGQVHAGLGLTSHACGGRCDGSGVPEVHASSKASVSDAYATKEVDAMSVSAWWWCKSRCWWCPWARRRRARHRRASRLLSRRRRRSPSARRRWRAH